MLIVVDTNKIIAALLRDGTVRRALFCLRMMGVELLSPKELVEELLEHIEEIARRMGMARDQVFFILKENNLYYIAFRTQKFAMENQ